jgi:branched-chain amino acid transport system permease protein
MAVGLGLCLLGALALLPVVSSDFVVTLATDILIFSLFAASLHFILGPGGMVSFGHAAYFGLGAYGAALAVKYGGGDMILGLGAAPLAAGLGALLFGWFCVRLSGVYLAMLTLAAAQIVWSVAFQWRDVTGGDDGMLGIWPASWASDGAAFYYLTLVLCVGGVYLLRRMAYASFGYGLRAVRDSPVRAATIGIDQHRQQWFAFCIAGIFAGLAGGLYVFSKGSVFPDVLAIPRSIDGLIMVLLGGVQTLAGPIVGATVFTLLEDQIARFDYWRLILGMVILGLVVLAPEGLAGTGARIARSLKPEAA